MSIGDFAKRAGLTPSALRFYDDAGVLRPEQTDSLTGYRLYSEPQLAHAEKVRQLRQIGMPLATIRHLLTGNAADAVRLIDEQVAKVAADAAGIQQAADRLRAGFVVGDGSVLCQLPGPVLAAAVDQILATTIQDDALPALPALRGVRLDAKDGALTLTATDRFRLATRTLVPRAATGPDWAGTVAGEDLQGANPQLRRSSTVTLEAGDARMRLHLADGSTISCRLLTEVFPDYHLMASSLPEVTHRLTINTRPVLKALEQYAPEKVGVAVTGNRWSLLLPDAHGQVGGPARGPNLTVWFELTNVYPPLSQTLGEDVLLDLRGPDQPATVRSADDGDLTTLMMPCRAPTGFPPPMTRSMKPKTHTAPTEQDQAQP